MDYEYLILQAQESEADQCATCEFKGEKCCGQCLEETVVYNRNLHSAL